MFFRNDVIDFVCVQAIVLVKQAVFTTPLRAFHHQTTQCVWNIGHDCSRV